MNIAWPLNAIIKYKLKNKYKHLIYIKIQGSCQVLKELKGVKAKIGWKVDATNDPELQIPDFGIKPAGTSNHIRS